MIRLRIVYVIVPYQQVNAPARTRGQFFQVPVLHVFTHAYIHSCDVPPSQANTRGAEVNGQMTYRVIGGALSSCRKSKQTKADKISKLLNKPGLGCYCYLSFVNDVSRPVASCGSAPPSFQLAYVLQVAQRVRNVFL